MAIENLKSRPYRLRKSDRLLKKSSFNLKRFFKKFKDPRFKQNYRILSFPHFKVYCAPSERPKLGVSVQGNCGSVFRNKVKRTLREWFRVNKTTLQNFEYHFVVKAIAPLSEEIKISILEGLKKYLLAGVR